LSYVIVNKFLKCVLSGSPLQTTHFGTAGEQHWGNQTHYLLFNTTSVTE